MQIGISLVQVEHRQEIAHDHSVGIDAGTQKYAKYTILDLHNRFATVNFKSLAPKSL
jgi:hypothetical protein